MPPVAVTSLRITCRQAPHAANYNCWDKQEYFVVAVDDDLTAEKTGYTKQNISYLWLFNLWWANSMKTQKN